MLSGKLFRYIGVWYENITMVINRYLNYLGKKKEKHAREILCKTSRESVGLPHRFLMLKRMFSI